MHLLCTLVPRSAEDADEIFATTAAPPPPQYRQQRGGKYVTVVEVLLDDLGVWEEGKKSGPRVSREQRWAAVDVRGGVAVMDAFAKAEKKVYGELRLAAGFGGPRV